MPNDARLEVDVRVSAGGFRLHAAFCAEPGITVLFGPSGSGKSTTLAAIAGLVRPTEGRISLGSDVWFDATAHVDTPVHRRGVSLVFQSLALFPHLTALGNVEYGIDRALPRAERKRRAIDMLERMKVGHVGSRRPPTFSGGEAQRVALARAFAVKPKLLLLDEPFSALDASTKKELLGEVSSWVEREAIPTILVTHHPDEARALGQRVLFIEKGRITSAASIDDALLSAPKLPVAPKA